MQDFNKNIPRMLAIFAGNYAARSKTALEKEQLIKVLAQTYTTGAVEKMFRKYVPDSGFIADYEESLLMFAAVAATDIAYEKVLDAYNGKQLSFDKRDLKEGLIQGAIVALGNSAGLY